MHQTLGFVLVSVWLLPSSETVPAATGIDPTFKRVPQGKCTILTTVDPHANSSLIHVQTSKDDKFIGHHYIVQTYQGQPVDNEVVDYVMDAACTEAVSPGCSRR